MIRHKNLMTGYGRGILTIVPLNPINPCFFWGGLSFENIVDPDQLAFNEAIWSKSLLFLLLIFENSVHPDQLASNEAIPSGSTLLSTDNICLQPKYIYI